MAKGVRTKRKTTRNEKKTARNDWDLLLIRASILYHQYVHYAPVRTERFWTLFSASKASNNIEDAWLTTEAFRLSFKRVK